MQDNHKVMIWQKQNTQMSQHIPIYSFKEIKFYSFPNAH